MTRVLSLLFLSAGLLAPTAPALAGTITCGDTSQCNVGDTCRGLTPTCCAEPGGSTIIGSSGTDVILGSANADIIKGKAGDDIICAMGGDDDVRGGLGDDYIDAGSGDDIVVGGDDDDEIYGREGDDEIWGKKGADILEGNKGADFIWGGWGDDDVLWAQNAGSTTNDNDNDHIFGDGGTDTSYTIISAFGSGDAAVVGIEHMKHLWDSTASLAEQDCFEDPPPAP